MQQSTVISSAINEIRIKIGNEPELIYLTKPSNTSSFYLASNQIVTNVSTSAANTTAAIATPVSPANTSSTTSANTTVVKPAVPTVD